ncbi:thiamine diphosphokinase [Deltaproteobacteria bacterium TL4]
MKKSAMIVCNGTPPPKRLVKYLWKKVDMTICADGGARFMYQNGWHPQYIIGDLDSLPSIIRKKHPPQNLIHLEEQQTTDTDKALRFCLQHQINEVHLLGATGKRNDHFIANLEVMYHYSSQLRMVLWSKLEQMYFIWEHWQGILPVGTTISLLPVFGSVSGISTEGLAYPLCNQNLTPGHAPIGVSNRVVSKAVSVSVQKGGLLLILQYQPWK